MKYLYIGMFPPPYGGVTIKNKLLYGEISKHLDVKQSKYYNINKSIITRIFSLIIELFTFKGSLIIGLSRLSLIKVTKLLYYVNRKTMRNSIVFVMGGTLDQILEKNIDVAKHFSVYKKIYVEMEAMKVRLNSLGCENVEVFPNCRQSTFQNDSSHERNLDEIKCLFFSTVCREKGVNDIFAAASLLSDSQNNFAVDIYGHIENSYKEEFYTRLDGQKEIKYCGIFDTEVDNVYKKMHSYDVLLFPTKYSTEGIPGVLVESKIAGLPAIVSDNSYNSEIIQNGYSGIVLKQNSAEELALEISRLLNEPKLLCSLAEGAKKSSSMYYIENYIDSIINTLRE
ncbi:MAG: glycosyltransferase [Gudongella sp.]|nr:glycosyltransferase [Gudongella sp.]